MLHFWILNFLFQPVLVVQLSVKLHVVIVLVSLEYDTCILVVKLSCCLARKVPSKIFTCLIPYVLSPSAFYIFVHFYCSSLWSTYWLTLVNPVVFNSWGRVLEGVPVATHWNFLELYLVGWPSLTVPHNLDFPWYLTRFYHYILNQTGLDVGSTG